MNVTFKDKVIVITGAAGGIGQSVVNAYLESGAKVAMLDRDLKSLELLQDNMIKYDDIKSYEMNLLDVKSIEKSIEAVLKDFGRIDVLVQIAGLMNSANSENIDEGSWDKMFDINTKGSFFTAKITMEKFMKENGGSIINFSSSAAIR